MEKRRFSWVISFIIILLSGCSQTSMTAIGMNTDIKIPTKTPAMTLTMSSVPTKTTTHTKTITPTQGPPPELELINISIFPEHENMVGDYYNIFGRIRNNTDKIMVFFSKDIVIIFNIDVWQRDKNADGTYRGYAIHSQYIDKAERGGELSRSMNCILYPHEEGIYYYNSQSNRPREDYSIFLKRK